VASGITWLIRPLIEPHLGDDDLSPDAFHWQMTFTRQSVEKFR
jgi:hypothetical protein